MKVGFYSPLPPARTGVADYAATLLAALRRRGSVEVACAEADVFLYHLGNNPLHGAIYRRALARPGVIVLHDAVLHHFFLGSMDEAAYVEEFVYNYGEWYRVLARDLWRDRASAGSSPRYYQYAMLKRAVEASRAVIVHNPAAAELVRRHAPATPVVEVPHLFQPPELPSAAEVLAFRRRLGMAGAFVFGVFGYLRESKRLLAVLRAFEAVRRARPNTALLVAGQFVSSDLARAVAPLLARPGIVRLPYLPEREFWRAAAAVDASISLRYPAAGETSGVSIRLMGIGKPVLLTAGLETSRYPQTACLHVDPGLAEQDSLWHHMILLISISEVGRAIGRRGAEHIALHHSVDCIAEQYWKTLCAYRA